MAKKSRLQLRMEARIEDLQADLVRLENRQDKLTMQVEAAQGEIESLEQVLTADDEPEQEEE